MPLEPALAAGGLRLFARPFVGGALLVRRHAALARNLALQLPTHHLETAWGSHATFRPFPRAPTNLSRALKSRPSCRASPAAAAFSIRTRTDASSSPRRFTRAAARCSTSFITWPYRKSHCPDKVRSD